MGAPKQRWTAAEEAALKAGVVKHGAGKWRTILRDPEFSSILKLRSNVDLKDKWRNLSVTAGGWGSREKARMALKKSRRVPKSVENSMVVDTGSLCIDNDTVIDTKPLAVCSEPLQNEGSPDKSVARLDNLIIEAIEKLKEPSGSSKTAIGTYIEEQYWLPADFQRLLSAKLKALIASGNLIKVNRKYRIAPNIASPDQRSREVLSFEETKRENDVRPLNKPQVDAELAEMRNMTAEEAAAFAAKAVAEAEAAAAEAEEAARKAEAAEADAEAANAFYQAALLTLKSRNAANVVL